MIFNKMLLIGEKSLDIVNIRVTISCFLLDSFLVTLIKLDTSFLCNHSHSIINFNFIFAIIAVIIIIFFFFFIFIVVLSFFIAFFFLLFLISNLFFLTIIIVITAVFEDNLFICDFFSIVIKLNRLRNFSECLESFDFFWRVFPEGITFRVLEISKGYKNNVTLKKEELL